MASRQKLDHGQLTAYFDRLMLSSHIRRYSISDLTADQQIDFLSRLYTQHLHTIPFENLTLLYSHPRFIDVELFPEDLAVLNLGPSTSRTSFFTQKVLCVKLAGGNEFYAKFTVENGAQRQHNENGVGYVEGDVIDGVLILDGAVLKWRKRGVKQWEVILKTEGERTRALEDVFGICLSAEDRETILGTASALIDHPGRFRK
ncbi:arylamine n-acetyltransferase 3 [Fusarium langsethiae]|uniref:Tpa: arylamine n-acetyltransferase 3 n=3 Tax=Fusarium sambucinum species complex TaxID=569360 RepID=A0A0M9EP67_FUSLA|nr:arylamine n-acetyltransferase 3 [Fusarium langsethiae]OBS20528.1 hypothetical protein FPOA_06891 [Fusarium poae]GKU07586.1 unnamed protein product [Fusarium langsethiae]CAF3454327.1 unnamed protein product [Fusarium graminearum]